MLRNRAVALILCWLASPLAYSLGLGPLEASSGLNEPFEGRIQILGAKDEDFDALTVGLAGEEQFVRAGIERHPALFQLRFTFDDTHTSKDYIAVTSKDPIREPFLNFLLEMNWANGRLVREYTVLLDPPLYDVNRGRTAAPAPAPVAPSAARPAAAASSTAPVAAATAGGAYGAGQQIGPVQGGDTLWSLASSYRPDGSVSVQQMMLALLRENPDAFSSGNINLLRRGAVLRLPDQAAINAMTASEAYAEVRRQHQLWEEYRQQAGSAPSPQPMGAAPPAAAEPGPATAATSAADARLELVAPGGTEGGGTPGGAATSGSGGELMSEAIDAKSQEAAELKDKLKEAEEIIDLLQRQVNIKDDELAALQARLAELGVKTDIAPAAPAEGAAVPATPEEPAAGVAAETPAPAEEAVTAPEATEDLAEIEGEPTAAAESPSPAEEPAATVGEETEIAVEQTAPAAAGFPANLIPAGLAALVPGGALTILGAAVVVLLGLFAGAAQYLIKSRAEREATPLSEPRPRRVESEAATITGPTVAHGVDDSEAVTEFTGAEAVTEVPTFDPNATVEAAAEPITQVPTQPSAEVGDPLEEVNVYLAYERFDQAEELVKRVIAQYPLRHEYKLRLLEVYYSSNDRAAYETAARELFDAVGERDPLWASAVAMWSEMSPERALFAEGAPVESAPAPESAKAFVDITGEGGQPERAESTLAHLPGGADDGELDFNLGAAAEGDHDVLDLTATADGADIFDLTATTDAAQVDLLDITAGESETDGVLDITGGNELADIAGLNDLDLQSGSDLLDVTKTGDISRFEDHDILNVTSPGLRGQDALEPVAAHADTGGLAITELDAGAADSTRSLDFDISGTVAPAFISPSDDVADDDGILDITSGGGGTTVDEALDFDIGGLDAAPAAAPLDADQVATVDLESVLPGGDAGGGLDLDLTMGADDSAAGDLDFDITMGSDDLQAGLGLAESADDDGTLEISIGPVVESDQEGELSLRGSALDELALDGTAAGTADDDFDFALDGTTEMDGIAADDTLDMASVTASNDEVLDAGDEASLDDLTMELDSALGNTSLDTVELEVAGDDLLSTMSLEIGDVDEPGRGEQTVIMPRGVEHDQQSDSDEADTKLNLAKAYIELGDTDGARSILDEVAVDGNDMQKAEARALLGQLSG